MQRDLVLESLEIRRFRAFRELTVPHLGRVNLIVGKNNVGKTTLLEALRLYARPGTLEDLLGVLTSRDELQWTKPEDWNRAQVYPFPVDRLFHGRKATVGA